jgi:hypothetical protein
MLRQFSHQQSLPIQIILIIVFGLFLGGAVLELPPLILLAGLSGIVFVVVVVKWPEIALLGILFVSSTIIDMNALPSISIGIGHLISYDFILIIPLAVVLVRALAEPRFKLFHTPVTLPMVGFYGIAILSTLMAIYQKSVSFNQSLSEIRDINGYLTFFMVTYLIRDERHLQRLVNGILLLSILVAIAMIVQYVVGSSIVILPGRVEDLGSEGITRVLPPGQSLVMIGFITTIILIIVDKKKTFTLSRLFQAFVLGFAVVITFNRNFWAAIGMALLLMACLIPIPNKVKLIKFFSIALLIVIIIVPVFLSLDSRLSNLVDSVTSRFMTMFNPNTLNESSLKYREVENSYVFPQIASHPFLGLGLGTIYRPWDRRIDPPLSSFTYEKRAYIHNGHLWVILKTGLVGYFFLMWSILLFLKRSFQKWQQISNPFLRTVVLSFAVSVVGLLASAVVNPIFQDPYWAPIIGIMLATNEVIFRIDIDKSHVATILEH